MVVEVWIGLAGVKPGTGENILGEDKGGYVNILLKASSVEDYHAKVKQFLSENNLELQELEDVEKLSTRLDHHEIEEKLIYLAKVVKRTGVPQFGTLHTFD